MFTLNFKLLIILSIFPNVRKAFPVNDDENVIETDVSHLGKAVFQEPNPEVGKKLESWYESHPENPEEFGEYVEGDIIFPIRTRNGIVGETLRWKDGVVPYEISKFFPTQDVNIILRAMEIYKKYTCVTFRPRVPSDKDYLAIVNGATGCWSSVGRIRGRQEVNLQSPYCTTKVGTPLHELTHAIGFLHEQNRDNRDDFVTIAWQNIKKGHENNFDKAATGTTNGYGVIYDFRSVMHYSNTAFSSNGKPTIIPKDTSKVEKMGQRDGFSKGDITKINEMYKCPQKTQSVTGSNKPANSSLTPAVPDKDTEGSSESSGTNLISAAGNFLSSLFTS